MSTRNILPTENLTRYNFNSEQPLAFIKDAVDIFKVEINMRWDESKKSICVDFNTGAKAHLHMYIPSDHSSPWFASRYTGKVDIENLHDLLWAVKDCMRGREYVSESWLKAFIDYDIVKVQYKQVREIIF